MLALINRVDSAAVEACTLVSSITATGTIGSVQSKEITVAVSGVELGDYVQTGDKGNRNKEGVEMSNLLGAPAAPSVSSIILSLTFSMATGIFSDTIRQIKRLRWILLKH